MSLETEINFIKDVLEKSGHDPVAVRVRKAMRGEKPNAEGVAMLVALVASATSIRTPLRKQFLEDCAEVLIELGMSPENIKALRDANPIQDDYDPSFLNIRACIKRVADAQIPYQYGLPWAKTVIEKALGTGPITPYFIAQLWLALAFFWEQELAPGLDPNTYANPSDTHFSSCAPRPARDIQLACVKLTNELKNEKWRLDEPASWTISQELDFRS